MKIRKDNHGLYIRSRFYTVDKNDPAYRPGEFASYSHVYDTNDGGLKEGDSVKASHVSQAPLIKIRLENGRVLFWGSHGRTEGDFPEEQ
jgi:hypothetical protein